MSTENNLETLFESSIKILTDLIAFKTISGNPKIRRRYGI